MRKQRYLVVARGLDTGLKLLIDATAKTVGRGRTTDLVLSDPNVSRSHFQVVTTEAGARVTSSAGAAPIIYGERPTDIAELAIGDSILIGNTVLLLTEEAPADASKTERGATSARTLLSGVAMDVHGLAAVYALNEALIGARNVTDVREALSAWARSHADTAATELLSDDGEPSHSSSDDRPVVETVTSNGAARLVVPTLGTTPLRIAFTTTLPPERVSDSLRRLLVVATAVCASSLGRVDALARTEMDRDSLRKLAIGSARTFSGESSAAKEVARLLPKIAAATVTVLLLGETGVGKSFVARLIHESGPNADAPFRVINCAAIPENLVESELFGHERGAFSGAVAAREGALESAGRGTLLLDEIGEMPLASQVKLLRVLEERRFERLGSNRAIPLHARVVTATNRDLETMIAEGKFRSDLFFRISVVTLVVPPLRERADDLVLLANQVLSDLAPSAGRRVDGFSPEALDVIRRYAWPGNVRELRNAIEHALVLGDHRLVQATDFPAALRGAKAMPSDDASVVRLPAPLKWLEERAIEAALRAAGGNRARAAALLGIKPAVLYYKTRQEPGAED